MKNLKILIIAILLIITAAISAGCTGSEKQTTLAMDNTPQATQIAAEETAVPTETTGPQGDEGLKTDDQLSSTEIFSRSYNWIEYRENTTSEMPPNGIVQNIAIVKTERKKTEYNGEPAIYMKTTYKAQGWTSVYEQYYNTAMSMLLGGKRTEIKEGHLPEIEDLPAKELDQESRPFGEKNFTLVYQGT